MKKLIIILGMLLATSVQAQDRGVFTRDGSQSEIHVRSTTSTASTDTTMIDSVSFDYQQGFPTMTVFYKFIDTGTVATTMYFETKLQGKLTVAEYVIVDSLVVSTTDTDWRIWNITDGAIGVTDTWRLRKSATGDTLMALFRGFAEIPK